MTDDNQEFQQGKEEFKFDDDMDQFFDDSPALSEDAPAENLTKTQKLKHKFGGLGEKLSSKLPGFDKVPGKFKNRRVLMGIVFVILVIVIYMFMGGGSSSSTSKLANGSIQAIPLKPVSHSQVQQISATGLATKPANFADQGLNPSQATQPMKMPVPVAVPIAPPVNIANEFSVKPQTPSAPVISGVSKAQLAAALADETAKLQAASDKQLQAIAVKISQQYGQLAAANQKITDQMTQLEQQLVELKAEVAASHNNLKNLQGKVSDIVKGYVGSFNASGATTYNAVPRPVKVVPVVNTITYVVQAIVPGRAWLYGSNGQTISVGVGDKIDGYGNVMSIDSLAGTVTMNNGAVLKPGA